MSVVTAAELAADRLPDVFARWFAARGWQPRAHQLDLLAKARAGRSTLLIAPTGGGKTLAGFLPTLVELWERASPHLSPLAGRGRPSEARSGEGASRSEGGGDAPTTGEKKQRYDSPT
jgi:ATP-dependent Lhr-like helicase